MDSFSNLKPFFCSIGTKVIITTGQPGAITTEVVDVETGETCDNLADFPVYCHGAVGANLHGTPIVCGGWFKNLQTCYKLTNGGWQEFASMKEERLYAAGIMYENKFHLFGGTDDSSSSQTSEIISIDGSVEYGPELPEAVAWHAITSINSTVSLLSGGATVANRYSSLTWYFNHETNVFSSGPSLLQGRIRHGSATIVDKVTKSKLPIVTGGFGVGSFGDRILHSTEMLINGHWHSGTF